MLFASFDVPTVDDASIVSEFLLQIAEITHILEVQSHVGREDAVDHQFPHCRIGKCLGPIAPEDLRVCSTMERLKNGAIVVELCEGSIERNQESVIDTGVPHVVPYGGNKKCKCVEWFE